MTTVPDTTPLPTITKIELPINVRDAATARSWYADRLGIVFDDRNRAVVRGVTLVLFEFADVMPCSHVVIQLVTDDLAETHRRLSAQDPGIAGIDEANWNLAVSDPSGNRIVFYELR